MIEKLLTRAVSEIIVKENLEKLLASGKKLRVKFGIDPTAPDLHLGHTVPLRKLRQFQDAGHQAILIIGDFTAMIGDPSGRAGAREPITHEQAKSNMNNFLRQAGKILDVDKLEIHYNSEWLGKLNLQDIVNLTSKFTVQQIIQREDFANRLASDKPVGVNEELYPILQAYDSVVVKADVELGGVDQKLNLIAGRHLMEKMGLSPQQILLTPLIEGTDGAKKMSKNIGNYIALNDEADEMFGKIMAVPDELMPKYFECLTDVDMPLEDNPRNVKLFLAKTIVEMYHGAKAGESALKNFVEVFSEKKTPNNIAELGITSKKLGLIDLLLSAGVSSKSEARRLVEQGGVKIDGVVKTDPQEMIEIKNDAILQIGKRKFFKLKIF
jgi:tyrosyl-tRNA synthetase